MLWAYQNTRKFFRRSSPGDNNSGNGTAEAGRNRLYNYGASNFNNPEPPSEMSQIQTTETTTLSPGTPITEEGQLPPKYEDIESHPIVVPHPLSVSYADDTLPPKYEDILQS